MVFDVKPADAEHGHLQALMRKQLASLKDIK